MSQEKPSDPFAMFRDMVNQWETQANEWGNRMMTTPEAAKAMQMGTATTLRVQEATRDAMSKALAAANMPSRADVEAMGARLMAMEGQLARIEALLSGAAAPQAESRAPTPRRTRKPPPKAR